jgi:serine/threonine protein kinase
MSDIVSLYTELSSLSKAAQQSRLCELKNLDFTTSLELEKMLLVDDVTLSSSEFLSQQLSISTPTAWQSFIGQQVMGFTIKGLLSEAGGMGVVLHAEQTLSCPNNGRNKSHKAAIKVLRSDKLNSTQQKMMLFSEASNLMSLDHPNICSIYGVSEVLNHGCIVMDFIDGLRLDEWLAINKANNKQKISVFIQLLNAVSYLHELQIYHGDLKPQNIIINEQGHLVLIDLGLAKHFVQAESDDSNIETVKAFSKNWSAPEQIAGASCKPSSDVYSLGAIMFYLLTDHSPKQKNSVSIQNRELRAMLNKALATPPENRYQDAKQLRTVIQRYQQGLPINEYSTNPIYRLKKLIGRKPFTSLACLLMIYSAVSSVLLFVK